jgi:hypothetical protein
MAGSNRKKKRNPKVSKGINGGGGKTRLTELQKALMGKGIMAKIRRAR